MTIHNKITLSGKGLFLLAGFSLAALAMASPSMADSNRNGRAPVYAANNYDADDYRSTRPYKSRNMHNNHRNMYKYGNKYSPRQQYPWLNRINQYGVRGKIVKWGRGPLQGCFRVKRTGRFQGDSAIVTVRYCQDGYGQARFVRGTKRLVRYLNYYRPTTGYGYRQPMRRY